MRVPAFQEEEGQPTAQQEVREEIGLYTTTRDPCVRRRGGARVLFPSCFFLSGIRGGEIRAVRADEWALQGSSETATFLSQMM